MTITELQHQYAGHPNVEALNKLLGEPAVRHIYCGGLYASAASLFASALVEKSPCPFVFILGDLEEAGYFYHDLTQVLGTEQILFFPSSFRRSVKYGQKDAALLTFLMRPTRYCVPRYSAGFRKVSKGCASSLIRMRWPKR